MPSPTAARLRELAAIMDEIEAGAPDAPLSARAFAERIGYLSPGAPWDDYSASSIGSLLDALGAIAYSVGFSAIMTVGRIEGGDLPMHFLRGAPEGQWMIAQGARGIRFS